MTDVHRIRSTAALLASDNDGEALGAARALCRLLGKQGLEPAGVVGAGLVGTLATGRPETRTGPAPVGILRPHQRTAMMALAFAELLTDWELSFLDSVAQLRTLSPKQQVRFDVICAKIDRAHQ